MKITFVAPQGRSGGGLVLGIYARRLAAKGHRVVLISPGTSHPKLSLARLRGWVRKPKPVLESCEGGVERWVLDRPRPATEADVPDADIIIATWWETAEWVSSMSNCKGRKIYFVQGHEVFPWLPQERAHATYRLPLHKIVISKWLADIMRRDYGDRSARLIPNGVDHSQFYGLSRFKQQQPTVGLLYSSTPLKAFDESVALLEEIHRKRPDLRVVCFGLDKPRQSLPKFVSFTKDPPRDQLRHLYAACDVWLSGSLSEGFNMTVVEAMACGTPAVAFRTGWSADGLTGGQEGACADIGDFNALRLETERFLDLTDSQWRGASEKAVEAVSTLSWERSAEAFEAALLDVSSGRWAAPPVERLVRA